MSPWKGVDESAKGVDESAKLTGTVSYRVNKRI